MKAEPKVTAVLELMCECGGPCDESYTIEDFEYDALGPLPARPAIRSPLCKRRLLDGETIITTNNRFQLIREEGVTVYNG